MSDITKADNFLLVEHKRWQLDHDQRAKQNLKQAIFWTCIVVLGSMTTGAAIITAMRGG